MRVARGEHGFTLVELLVTMTITTIVFGATLSVLDVFQRNNRFEVLRNETQDNARTAADRLARQLRNVAAPSTGAAGALEQKEPYSIIFQSIDPTSLNGGGNATHAMRVRYCLDASTPTNEVLWTQVKRWAKEPPAVPTSTACPDPSAADFETNTQLVQHVTNENGGQNRPVFSYSAEGIPQTTSVEMNLFLDLNPGHRPGETQLTSGVALRNANRPPTAKIKWTLINKHVSLNATESANPDGLALTYQWWKDGVLQTASGAEWETKEESSGTHTYELEITDPSGLSDKAKETVPVP
ncbi:MAG TPA: prepilin-type N-terminal cleavage/methylation domain-containing protein [Solirubrobacteraceae bacterium]|jgi:prepilin-type N-terminal cleavage/methylation domain-containing protein|nr:prepilin-type N-terminal cleavage/methylation domain-containing protein [Solirubrobacteraceae bacterium]